jgi:hypothetical protein
LGSGAPPITSESEIVNDPEPAMLTVPLILLLRMVTPLAAISRSQLTNRRSITVLGAVIRHGPV